VGAKTMVTPTHSISRYGSSVFAPVEGARRRDEPIRTGVSPSHGTRQPSPRQAVSLSKDRLGMDPCCHMNPRLKTLEPHLAPGTYTPKEGSIKESVAAKVNPRSPGTPTRPVSARRPCGIPIQLDLQSSACTAEAASETSYIKTSGRQRERWQWQLAWGTPIGALPVNSRFPGGRGETI
jgi:hypothetical protein